MSSNIVRRVVDEANYILETRETIRNISHLFKVSKSTVHKDLHERLIDINPSLYLEVDSIFKHHKNIRHIRGGNATKKKYTQNRKDMI